MVSNGFSQALDEDSTGKVLSGFAGWTENDFGQIEDSVGNASYSDVKVVFSESFEEETRDETEEGEMQIFNNTYVPSSISINTSLSVGEIPMTSSVTQTGAVVYTVPIEVYPGMNGMQPNLALVYNSQAGNGIMGMGWNIGGISSIKRGNKSIYYDGTTEGMKMNANDAFYLDGIRLIRTGESGYDKVYYESEQGYIKVTAHVSNYVYVTHFEVFFPNGTRGIYGYYNNPYVYQYYNDFPLYVLSDLYGNTIEFTYTYSQSNFRLDKISYANASLVFEYETRPDVITSYSGGLTFTENKRLKKITCKFGSSTLRNYLFSYENHKNSSVLKEIGYSSGNNVKINPLKFWYGEGNDQTGYDAPIESDLWGWHTFTNPAQVKAVKGRFNYETDTDGLVVLPRKYPYQLQYNDPLIGKGEYKFINNYKTNDTILLYKTLSSPIVKLTGTGFIDILTANLDGKKGEEIIKVNNYVSGNYDRVVFTVFNADPYESGFSDRYTRTFNFQTLLTDPKGNKSIQPKHYFAGDFLGNGKSQILAVSIQIVSPLINKSSECYLFDLEASSVKTLSNPFGYRVSFNNGTLENEWAIETSDRLVIIDYDGDGKSDILLINQSGTYIYTFDVTYNSSGAVSSITLRQVTSFSSLTKADVMYNKILFGDLNGDGKTDFILSGGTNTKLWDVYYSRGNGLFDKKEVNICYPSNTRSYFFQDINSDGFLDFIEYGPNTFTTYLGNGTAFTQWDTQTFALGYSNPILIPSSANSGYYSSQLLALKNDKVFRYSCKRNDTKEKLLTGAASSLGVIDKNEYSMLYRKYYFYSVIDEPDFPHLNYFGPLFAVERREQYYKGERTEELHYQYQRGIIHKQGFGFRGFEKMTIRDYPRNRWYYKTYDPFKFGVLVEDESPIAKTKFYYNIAIGNNKTYRVVLRNRSTLNKLNNTRDSMACTYNPDNYNFPLIEKYEYGDGITEIFSNSYYHNTNESGYLLGYLTNRLKTTTRNGESFTERYQVVDHDTKGKPKETKTYVNDNQVSYQTFDYYTNGNLKKQTEKSFNSSKTFETNYEYNNWGRLTKETDPMGFETQYGYDNRGRLNTVTNHKGQTTVLNYTNFDRVALIDYPDGTKYSKSFSWNTAGTNGLFCIQQTTTGKPWTKNYFDVWGRETATDTQNFNNTITRSENKYDDYGRLEKVSLPYLTSTSASYWNNYNYDYLDRLTSIVEASGRTTSYSYSDRNVTIKKDGIQSTQKYDTQGNLIEVVDPAGTVTYNLRPDGQPKNIVAPGNVNTSFTYDNFGRRLTIVDPSAGTQTWTYDNDGNIRTEKDANGKTITFLYDDYNRLENVNRPEFNTTYVYNTDGLLESITSTNGTSTVYTYDTYGRLKTEKETVPDSKWLEKTYSYSNSNVSAVDYTSNNGNIVKENYSYSYGHLTEIKLNNTTSIWKLNETNAFNQPTKVATGGFDREYAYNAFGLPTGRKSNIVNYNSFQNHTYNFNAATGNLNSRKDNVKNIQENFGYDELNRMTEYAGKTAAYDTKGNITKKSDIGTSFKYNTVGKPYAISRVANPTDAISKTEQKVTYTSFKRPATIIEGIYNATFTYNGSGARVKTEVKKNGAKELNRYYISDCYELDDRAVGGNKEKLYLGGNFYTAPVVYVKDGNAIWQLHYIFRDYLGSITHIVKSHNGSNSMAQELSYDAWGRLRNPANQTPYTAGNEPDLFLGRGYTGHEHLPWFGVINMNARLYDPAVGRFLSPDSYVQLPDFSQSFNRYAYAWNNPMRYYDEDGESLLAAIIIGAVVYAAIEYGTQVYQNYQISKQLEAQGIGGWSDKDIWLRRIDWFDVGISAVGGALTPIFPVAAPFIKYGTPVIHNAFNWYGDGNFETVFNGDIPLNHFLINTGLDLATTFLVSKFHQYNGVYGSKPDPNYQHLYDNFWGELFENGSFTTINSVVEYTRKAYTYPYFYPVEFNIESPKSPTNYWNTSNLKSLYLGDTESNTSRYNKKYFNGIDLSKYLKLSLIPTR